MRDLGEALFAPFEWDPILSWDDWVAAILADPSRSLELIPPAFVWRDEEQSRPESSRALLSGPCITATGGYPNGPWSSLALHVNLETVDEGGVDITPVEDARRKAQVLVDAGADVIKICLDDYFETRPLGILTEEQISAITEVAHDGGLRVTAHVSADRRLETVLAGGVDSAAHIPLDEMSDENISTMVADEIPLIPTLAVWETMPSFCTDHGACFGLDNLTRYVDAGGVVALGDDYGNSGIVLGMPLRDFVWMEQAGMSNMDIIVAATANAAAECGLGHRLGTLEQGMLADVIVLGSDPLDQIASMADVIYVVRDGVVIRQPD